MKKKVVILTQSTNQFVLVVLLLFGLVWSTVQATELRLDGDLVMGMCGLNDQALFFLARSDQFFLHV